VSRHTCSSGDKKSRALFGSSSSLASEVTFSRFPAARDAASPGMVRSESLESEESSSGAVGLDTVLGKEGGGVGCRKVRRVCLTDMNV
jgi:hypothetical protein